MRIFCELKTLIDTRHETFIASQVTKLVADVRKERVESLRGEFRDLNPDKNKWKYIERTFLSVNSVNGVVSRVVGASITAPERTSREGFRVFV